MTVDEFAEHESKYLQAFVAAWTKQQQQRPHEFPAELNLSEWAEQFSLFSEMKAQYDR